MHKLWDRRERYLVDEGVRDFYTLDRGPAFEDGWYRSFLADRGYTYHKKYKLMIIGTELLGRQSGFGLAACVERSEAVSHQLYALQCCQDVRCACDVGQVGECWLWRIVMTLLLGRGSLHPAYLIQCR